MKHIKFAKTKKNFTSEDEEKQKKIKLLEWEISSIQESLNCINDWKLCI